MSEGLSRAVKDSKPETEETPGEWEYVGTVSGVESGLYSGERAEKLGKYLAGSANQRRPPGKGKSARDGAIWNRGREPSSRVDWEQQ